MLEQPNLIQLEVRIPSHRGDRCPPRRVVSAGPEPDEEGDADRHSRGRDSLENHSSSEAREDKGAN